MKKSQVSIIQFSLLVLFSIAFLSAIFILSQHIQETSTDEFNKYHIDNIAARIKKNLVNMKTIEAGCQISNFSSKMSIPQRIGPNEYLIRGNGTDLVFQTYGGNSIIRRVPIYYWNVDMEGSVFSTGGVLELTYYESSNKVRIS